VEGLGEQENHSNPVGIRGSAYNVTKEKKPWESLSTCVASSLRNMYMSGKRWMLKTVPSSLGNSLAYVTHIVGRATCGLSGDKCTGYTFRLGKRSPIDVDDQEIQSDTQSGAKKPLWGTQ